MTSEVSRGLSDVAQTNLQLYNQLHALGWSGLELSRVSDAYELSTRILAARFRPDGKPFGAHGIGTASILAASGCDVDVVLAGLLHAAYAWGEWGEGSHRMTDSKRAAVREVIGPRAERIVAAYTGTPWTESAATSVLARVGRLDADERDMVLLKVANALDDNLDLGMRYRGVTASEVAADRLAPLTVEIARHLGMTPLADRLEAARDAQVVADVPGDLAFEGGYVQIAPLTHRRRMLVWFRAQDTAVSRTVHRAVELVPERLRRLVTPR